MPLLTTHVWNCFLQFLQPLILGWYSWFKFILDWQILNLVRKYSNLLQHFATFEFKCSSQDILTFKIKTGFLDLNLKDKDRIITICKIILSCNAMLTAHLQKQPSRGAFWKRCPENMQQIYKRTPMPKCDFNKVALQLYWNQTSACVFSCKVASCFQNTVL